MIVSKEGLNIAKSKEERELQRNELDEIIKGGAANFNDHIKEDPKGKQA